MNGLTWLGYEVILTNDQKIAALLIAGLFALFARFCGRPLWMCGVAACAFYGATLLYIISENTMYQIKSEFCTKHPEINRCGGYP